MTLRDLSKPARGRDISRVVIGQHVANSGGRTIMIRPRSILICSLSSSALLEDLGANKITVTLSQEGIYLTC